MTSFKKSFSFRFVLLCVFEATNIQPIGAGGESESMPVGVLSTQSRIPIKAGVGEKTLNISLLNCREI